MRVAITRDVSPAIARCELTHLARTPIDFEQAQVQHRAYQAHLRELGCDVVRLPAADDLPDSVFVEDTAVVLDELAVITRPGAESRRAEAPAVAEALARYRRLAFLEAPATLDGGDVLRLGRQLLVGRSQRTNQHGIAQLRALAEPLGYAVQAVEVRGCLHLKSAVTQAAAALLVNPAWLDVDLLPPWQRIEVDPAEPFAANALLLGDALLMPSLYPRTRRRLEARRVRVVTVDVSELMKAEGGVTCCSLLLDV